MRVAPNQERVQLAQTLATGRRRKNLMAVDEILAIGADKVHEFEKQSPQLAARFDFFLDNVLRAAPHTLSPESEGVMAAASNVLIQPNISTASCRTANCRFPA